MKIVEISMDSIKKRLKQNLRIIIMIIICNLFIGILVGVISAMQYSPKEDIDRHMVEEKVNFNDIPQNDGAYYFNRIYALKAKNDYLNAYLLYFEQVSLSIASREQLEAFRLTLKDYDKNLSELFDLYWETPVALSGEKNETISFYEDSINRLERKKQKSLNLLDQIISGNYLEDYKTAKQDEISKEIDGINEEIALYSGLIVKLNASDDVALKNNSDMLDDLLRNSCDQLNELVVSFNDIITVLSQQENYEIIFNKRLLESYEQGAGVKGSLNDEAVMKNRLNDAIIYAKSIEGLDLPKERFLAIFTFFMLFGLSVSFVVGIVYQRKRK